MKTRKDSLSNFYTKHSSQIGHNIIDAQYLLSYAMLRGSRKKSYLFAPFFARLNLLPTFGTDLMVVIRPRKEVVYTLKV